MIPQQRDAKHMKDLGTTVYNWRVGLASSDARWWIVIFDGLTFHEGPERDAEVTAAGDLAALVCHLEDMVVAAKQRTGMMGAN